METATLTLEQLVLECERRGLKVTTQNPEHNFSVIARYERGLGPEYVNLQKVTAKTISEAQEIAISQTYKHFAETAELQEAVINEVRIRPIS